MQAMDVFVFPSLYEGLGVVLIEAQASGLPCIISKNIPNEACISDLVEKVDITTSDLQRWCNIILNKKKYKRRDMKDVLYQSGYDVNLEIDRLQKFYISKC